MEKSLRYKGDDVLLTANNIGEVYTISVMNMSKGIVYENIEVYTEEDMEFYITKYSKMYDKRRNKFGSLSRKYSKFAKDYKRVSERCVKEYKGYSLRIENKSEYYVQVTFKNLNKRVMKECLCKKGLSAEYQGDSVILELPLYKVNTLEQCVFLHDGLSEYDIEVCIGEEI